MRRKKTPSSAETNESGRSLGWRGSASHRLHRFPRQLKMTLCIGDAVWLVHALRATTHLRPHVAVISCLLATLHVMVVGAHYDGCGHRPLVGAALNNEDRRTTQSSVNESAATACRGHFCSSTSNTSSAPYWPAAVAGYKPLPLNNITEDEDQGPFFKEVHLKQVFDENRRETGERGNVE